LRSAALDALMWLFCLALVLLGARGVYAVIAT